MVDDNVRSAQAVPSLHPPSVTVAICTFERVNDLTRCLEAVVPQARDLGLRVVVIDSGSCAPSASALQRLAEHHSVEFARLEAPGVSLARNAAYAMSTSDWIVYLDDDATPAPDWAENLLAELQAAPADVAIVGGKISPKWPENANPEHITERWKLMLSCVERDGRGLVSDGFNICCANLAVRRSAMDASGGFPTTVGSVGTKMVFGEESYLIDRLAQLNLKSVYSNSFSVKHSISRERLQRAWIAGRAYNEGKSRVRIMMALGNRFPRDVSIPKLMASLPVLLIFCSFLSNPDWTIRYHLAKGSLVFQIEMLMQRFLRSRENKGVPASR